MEKLYYKLLILSWHYLTAFALCDYTSYYKEVIMYDRCPRENYYCNDNYEQDIRVYSYTCTSTQTWEIENKLDRFNRGRFTYIVIKNSFIPTLIPDGYSWNNIVKLQIEETNTNEIIPGFFDTFDDLRELQITKNKIKTISNGQLSSMYVLYTLNLTENLIETVAQPQHSFSGLPNLRVVDLSKNKIAALPEGLFHYQKYLLYVDISNNVLKCVGFIFNGDSLKTIDVSHNLLNNFDFNLLHSSNNITKIDLSNNMIDTVVINAFIYIENISLAYNKISILSKIGNIQFINITHNRIHSINVSESNDIIESIDLNGNDISVLSNHLFTNLTNLKYLCLSHNNLTLLQIDALHNLHNLHHLDLSFNKIRQIPFGFFNDLDKLTYLDLSDNNMVLDFHVLSTLKSLQMLKFTKNKVQNFDSDILLSRFQFLHSITLSDDSWNCTELASIIHKLQLKNINLTPGQNRNVSNILGISCKDNTDLKEDTIIIERNNNGATNKDVGFYPSAEKIDAIFSDTLFFKYLQTVAKHISDKKSLDSGQNDTRFMENFNIYAANMQEYNNKSMGYMREIYNNTNFLKYLNSSLSSFKPDSTNLSNKVQSNWSEMFNQTLTDLTKNIISWQNKTFNEIAKDIKPSLMAKNVEIFNQTLIDLTKNMVSWQNKTFNEISNNMKQVSNSNLVPKNDMESKALIGEKRDVSNNSSLIFINIFLAMILCCLIFFAYHISLKAKLINSGAQEQVQLM